MRFKKLIESAGTGIELAPIIGTSTATISRRKRDPDSFTFGEIILLLKSGVIDKADFFNSVETELKRKK